MLAFDALAVTPRVPDISVVVEVVVVGPVTGVAGAADYAARVRVDRLVVALENVVLHCPSAPFASR